MSYIQAKNIYKKFKSGENEIVANNNISFDINEGELVIILGESGAGKSTLLNILGGIENVTSGNLIIDDIDISKFNEKELTNYRRNDVGFVFQFYNLIPNLTAKENVDLALEIVKNPLDSIEMLKEVGLEHRLNNFPSQLSGGEQQRVSIARALAKNPKIILCDEPTGALDYTTGKQILKILQYMSRVKKKTVIIVTHNSFIAPIANKIIHIHNATIKNIVINKNIQNIDDIEW